MIRDSADYVRRYINCNQWKIQRRGCQPLAQVIPKVTRPFARAQMDLAGPCTPTKKRNTYVLLYKDALKKWIELIPIKDKRVKTVTDEQSV
jgi:hypothetical protein